MEISNLRKRMSGEETGTSAAYNVVGFTCGDCSATLPVDSPTYEDILANGCVVCGTAADASAFSRRKTA